MRISLILGYGGSYAKPFKEVLESISVKYRVQYLIVTDASKPTKDVVEFIKSSDAILLYTHTLPQELVEAIRNSVAKVVLSFSENFQEFSRGVAILFDAWKYFKIGGKENLKSLIELVLNYLGVDAKPSPPQEIPWHGIWHPELGLFNSTQEYLKIYPHSNKPLVAIIFYRSYWLTSNTKPVEALVKALEAEGLGTLPVFTHGFKDSFLNTPTIEDSIKEFLIVNGKPIVDAVLVLTSFFILDHGKWHRSFYKDRFKTVDGVELLKALNIPVIKLVIDHYQSVGEWLANPAGVSPLTQVYHVIMPEVDGAIEPIFIAGAKIDENGAKTYEPFMMHASYVARRVRKWIELRNAKPWERRIAIVLNNPPCRGVEASIGVGMGLDVPETVARILHRLAELGYNVGDLSALPRDGKELMKMFLEKRATSEFRWTSVDDIVKRGGYVDMVPIDLYMQWFNELPEEVRKVMVSEWGDPRNLASGKIEKIFAGGIYNGKFVVPGLRFGNVVVIPQPKFGCAGAGCDGRICKILHNPTVPPPHQWLAVYRWITRVFKAHLILHVGTHGTLEFRPGKGVGLSSYCWPETTLDDVPFLYIYIVSNPMEGVIAKRRGYAAIVDHVYPPMMDARNGLEELDKLVEEFENVRRLGEEHRAKVVYSQIVSKVKELGLPINLNLSEEEIVSSVHRFLDMVRSSQVENGLHIFGYMNQDVEKIAKSVVTVMEFDTPSWKSIVRAVAMYLGLDYDEILSNPSGYCSVLGVSNRKAKEILMDIAQRVVKKLLEMGVTSSSLTPDFLENVLNEVVREVVLVGSYIHKS
ncbi:cobaltochelatase subunit CobN [Ignisphaera sp. 4213-co]|uniref:Cobaltochelatase subunit CobN n=1 Tax=Ignisphaera cupida TaxID=3050454 RepID=A0ABD4Z7L5_9CREN|nr:cobaltochelatase subunit CobN [Ignisphaera sp. 4213-co]MDK6028918.1 cobaltochelatase subunit CobN [Ignisphaera sp. 4213-co]